MSVRHCACASACAFVCCASGTLRGSFSDLPQRCKTVWTLPLMYWIPALTFTAKWRHGGCCPTPYFTGIRVGSASTRRCPHSVTAPMPRLGSMRRPMILRVCASTPRQLLAETLPAVASQLINQPTGGRSQGRRPIRVARRPHLVCSRRPRPPATPREATRGHATTREATPRRAAPHHATRGTLRSDSHNYRTLKPTPWRVPSCATTL